MPYKVFNVGSGNKPYCVHKVNPEGKRTGQSLGCHSTPRKAHQQIAAIEANEGKDMSDNGNEIVEEKNMPGEVVSVVPSGAISFGQVDEFLVSQALGDRVGELTRQFGTLTQNVMVTEGDKPKEMERLLGEFMHRVEGAAKDAKEPSFLERVFGRKEQFKEPEEEKESRFPKGAKHGFQIWKQGDKLRWLTVYSNKFRDRDNPPEIIASTAHKDFAAAIDEGDAELPELWLWHIPGTRIGEADWLAYDERGFMMASGSIDEGKEAIAENVAEMDVLVSHGMPIESIEREPDDDTVITRYVSKEISPLPEFAAANMLTDFTILKEYDMEIPEEKLEFLKAAGMEEGEIEELDRFLDDKAKEAEGLEFKESETAEAVLEAVSEAEPAEDEELVEVIEVDDELAEQIVEAVSREEVAGAIVEALEPFAEQMETLAKALEIVTKDDKEKIAETAAETPTLSIAALVAESFSARGSDATKIRKNDPLTKEKPKETEAQKESITGLDGFGFIDQIVRDSEKKDEE